MKNFKGVIFDLDGTLLDSMKVWENVDRMFLEENGIKTVTGKDVWSTSTIDRILSNEKYVGDVLMQKSFTEDFLTGKRSKNEGELSMYFIENDHEAIIEREIFEAVQKRKTKQK